MHRAEMYHGHHPDEGHVQKVVILRRNPDDGEEFPHGWIPSETGGAPDDEQNALLHEIRDSIRTIAETEQTYLQAAVEELKKHTTILNQIRDRLPPLPAPPKTK